MSPRKIGFLSMSVALSAMTLFAWRGGGVEAPVAAATAVDLTTTAGPRWFKGNLHTHSLWSDGDQFPELIAEWYRDHGYHFLAISDHNTLQQGEKWFRYSDLKKRGAGPSADRLLKDYAGLVKTRGDIASGSYEIRLTNFADYKPKFDQPGRYLLISSEEVSAQFDTDPTGGPTTRPTVHPIHMCATNLQGEAIKPKGGSSVVEVIRNNLRAIEEQGRKVNQPVLAHLNHPNFKWGVSTDDLAKVVEEHYFEVYNGHPIVNHLGNETHPSIERMWDLVNTMRLTKLNAEPLRGLGTDDTHNYHVTGMNRATAGRGWIYVRTSDLSAASLIAAMKAGEFYASSGVELADMKFDAGSQTLSVSIKPEPGAKYKTQFIGTFASADGKEVGEKDIGVVLATVEGTAAEYRLTGKELYVRAVVTSDQAPANPSFKDQWQQAWTQPIGWQRWIKN